MHTIKHALYQRSKEAAENPFVSTTLGTSNLQYSMALLPIWVASIIKVGLDAL